MKFRQNIGVAVTIGAVALGAITVVAFAAWRLAGHLPSSTEGQWVPVLRQSIVQPLLLKGVLLPVDSVSIVSPVNGRLKALRVQFGDKVRVGQLLAEVDSAELEQQLRDAEIAMIRSTQELTSVSRLEDSAEFQAALRRQVSATNGLTTAQKRAAETQLLYEKGIIARTELDGVQQELAGSTSQVQAALDEIATLKLKRSPPAMRVLTLELDNRRAHFDELKAKLRDSTLMSPISGVVLYPIPTETADVGVSAVAKEFKPGAFVTSRDVLFTVGDTTAFLIKLKVDEADLDRIALQQAVDVTMAADPQHAYPGAIQRISSQARVSDPRGAGASTTSEYEVQVFLKPPAPESTDKAPPAFRVGASVAVKIVPPSGPMALMVPLQSIVWDAQGKPTVLARKAATGPGRTKTLEVGRTSVDAVEVRAGVDEGDEVWIAAKPAAGTTPGFLHRMLGEDGEGE